MYLGRWCWHRWSKWHNATGRLSNGVRTDIQIRTCTKCAKSQIKELFDL